jgi:uncharacterized protein
MMKKKDREFQIFVKPAGAKCNLRCTYCYYSGKKDLYRGNNSRIMSYSILEDYIVQHIRASSDSPVMFSWHGGEPCLAGIDFFRKAAEFQKKHKPVGVQIINGIQTNGTLINEEWCRFLSAESFYVGVSIDGPEEMHNKFRYSAGWEGSFEKVVRGYELLKKYKIRTEILTVVHSGNVNDPQKVYRFLKKLDPGYLSFLPLVIRDPVNVNQADSISVVAEDFGNFLIGIFDEWISGDIGKIKIQIIEEAARSAFKQEHTICIFRKVCGGVPVLEHNGDFYSCDHYVDKDHLIGNLGEKSLEEMLDCKAQTEFGNAKLYSLPSYCRVCEVREMCNGECPKNRFITTPDGEPGLNYLCIGYRLFFNHIRPFVDAIAEEWRKGL